MRPLAMEVWAGALDYDADAIPLLRAPNWPQYSALLGHGSEPPRPHDAMMHLLDAYRMSALSRVRDYERTLNAVTHNRAMAVLLAARLFAAERGALPANLEDLKDMLGGRLPVDLYSEREQPLLYRQDANGPTVWSVGPNGVDDHADPRKDRVFGAANPPLVPPLTPPPGRGAGTTRTATRATTTRAATAPK